MTFQTVKTFCLFQVTSYSHKKTENTLGKVCRILNLKSSRTQIKTNSLLKVRMIVVSV